MMVLMILFMMVLSSDIWSHLIISIKDTIYISQMGKLKYNIIIFKVT